MEWWRSAFWLALARFSRYCRRIGTGARRGGSMRRQLSIFAVLLALMTTACNAPPAVEAPGATSQPPPAASDPLAQLTKSLAGGEVQVVDLTQPLTPTTPIINLPPPFANTPGFKKHEISNYDAKGPAWYWNWIEIGEHVGTHFDAPCHWVTGKGKACVDDLEAKQFIGPAVVIDVTADVAKSADYVLPPQTILEWEKTHGRIPNGAWVVLRTGWGSRSNDAKAFFNADPKGS